jgi:hypothetical protein
VEALTVVPAWLSAVVTPQKLQQLLQQQIFGLLWVQV